MATFYAGLIYQYLFKYQTVFSARFDKQCEDGRMLDEIELHKKLNINQNLSESEIDKIDLKSPPEHQIQKQEIKNKGWRFDKNNSMTIYFYKTTETDGSSLIKNPLRSSAILNIENHATYCFVWSILAHLHACNKSHTNRIIEIFWWNKHPRICFLKWIKK